MKPKRSMAAPTATSMEPKPPSEEDIAQASVREQRKQQRRYSGNRGGYMATVLSNRENKLG